jgi:hypothetical protein
MTRMRIDTSPHGLLLIAAVVVFILAAIGLSLGTINLVALGLALFAAAFVLG